MQTLGRPTVKAGPDYGEWHYPPELPDGYIVASRDRRGWLVRVRSGADAEKRVTVEANEVPGKDTLRGAAAVGLNKAFGGAVRRNPDEETEEADLHLATPKLARKAQKRVGLLRRLFSGGEKVAMKAGAKAGAKAAAKVGAKQAAKTGTKAIPGVGEVMMVLDAAPEAIRVEKEKYASARETKRRVKEAKGAKATAIELGKGVGEYATLTASGVLRVGAAAIVGSDTVDAAMKSIRKNPSMVASNYAEIAQMLRTMPRDWQQQYRSGRAKLGIALPDRPTPEQAMMLIGITAGGRPSGDTPVGPNRVPDAVRAEAMEGLRLSHKHNYGAWDFIGVARAIELAISPGVSDTTMSRMRNYFTRHMKDRAGKNWSNTAHPSRGRMAWLNWGGDAGYNWVNNMRKNPHYDLENPYHKPGHDQWGKVCFYIYNDDGSQVVGPMGPRFCYKVEKAEEMVREAERRGKRVSPSPVSPGPRPTPAPAAAPSNFVRQRIQEQAAKPITHTFRVGDIIAKKDIAIDTVDFYEVVSVSPASVMVKAIGKQYASGNRYAGTMVPDRSVAGYDSRHKTAPFRMMVGAGDSLSSGESWTRLERWDGQPVRVSSYDR